MPRINALDPKTATGEAKVLLDAVQKQLGIIPNFVRVLAHSPKALSGFLGLYGALGGAAINKATQERIALALAESNGCEYCVSAHTAIGRHAGLTNDEILLNRQGSSADARGAAAVAFAKALNDNAGEVTTEEFEAVRSAGFSDAEIVEIVAVVALNVLTNILSKSTRVEIEFPRVRLLSDPRHAAA
jgi:uncharacterized peroxidase-related enzyme